MTRRLRFGIFDFDPATRELRREGVPVRLQAQPAQVLAVLVEHAGELVTREQLQKAVWGTETFVDFERGLNFCIAQIRAALGDSAESPRFVRTVPKQGYRFVAPVGAAGVTIEESVPAPVAAPSGGSRRRVVLAWAASLVLVGCALAAVTMGPWQPSNIAVARFDNETGGADLDTFTSALTDAVITELTAAGGTRYGIIGNAAILRQPRSQRDLRAIGAALKARYVVLGQVQRNGAHVRVLAHLIRLPEQTHLWALRVDRDLTDPLQTESELAHLIASQFTQRLAGSRPAAVR